MVAVTPESLAASGTEDGHQSALFCYAASQVAANYRWGLLYAIPNGGKRGVATAARMAATGAKKGFPDIGLPLVLWRKDFPNIIKWPGFFLELKIPSQIKASKGGLSDAQEFWRDRLKGEGYAWEVGYGWQHAAELIGKYINEATQNCN